jgi:hypothetical protein
MSHGSGGKTRSGLKHREVSLMKALVFLFVLLLTAVIVSAQQPVEDHARAIRTVEQRYDESVETWRANLMLYLLRGQDPKLSETTNSMRGFTATTLSYIDLKRPGRDRALELYYLNLENISRLEQLRSLVDGYRRQFPNYTKDFITKYNMAESDFQDFNTFETAYGKVMDTWRERLEEALKTANLPILRELAADIQLLRFAVSGFVFFPGKSAQKVPQLQVMENDLRHAAVMLRMHEELLSRRPGATPAP